MKYTPSIHVITYENQAKKNKVSSKPKTRQEKCLVKRSQRYSKYTIKGKKKGEERKRKWKVKRNENSYSLKYTPSIQVITSENQTERKQSFK